MPISDLQNLRKGIGILSHGRVSGRLKAPSTKHQQRSLRFQHLKCCRFLLTVCRILHPHTTCVSVRVLQHNLLSPLDQIQALTFLPKMLTSSMTPFRSTSRPRISIALKQHRSLELNQQLMTRNVFFINCNKNGNSLTSTHLLGSPILGTPCVVAALPQPTQ
jgi:hypothetical protein